MRFMKTLVLLLMLAATIKTAYGQQHPRCYTDQLYEQAVKANPFLKEKRKKMDDDVKERIKKAELQKSGPAMNSPIVIPVIVTIVHANGVGNISDAQVISQLDALNAGFAGSGITFCLATKNGNNNINPPLGGTQVIPGIAHISNTANATHDIATEQQSLYDVANNTYTPDRYLKIWVVNDIVQNGAPTNILGYTYMPDDPGIINGIVIKNTVFGNSTTCGGCTLPTGYDQGDTLIHEVGHYLGLYHTFHEGCDEFLPGKNSDDNGDRVSDTPPAIETYDCNLNLDTCGSDNLTDDVQNFMSYSSDTCMTHFSPKQIERMHYMLLLYKSLIISVDNSIHTGVCGYQNMISATFEASNYAPCLGTLDATVSFDPLMSGVNYSWDFGDPASTNNTSNLEAPSHQYASAANSPYTVTLTINNGVTTSVMQKEIYVTACSPIQSTQGNWYFSSENALNFNTGAPKYDTSIDLNNISFGEASAVQCNAAGTMLFYTNGTNIYNNAHTIISAGVGNNSSHGGALIVPLPGSTSQYYVFTKDQAQGTNGFRYSIVNVTGTTASMVTSNVSIAPPAGCLAGPTGAAIGNEGVAAVASCNGYWIITANLMLSGTQYYLTVYELTSTGLASTPQGIAIPATIDSHLSIIKASPDGNRLAYIAKNASLNGTSTDGGTLLYTFNKYTGAITNPIDLQEFGAYGATFSPDSKLFYTGGTNSYQYNLSDANPAASRQKISAAVSGVGDWQIAPDNKIYITPGAYRKLAVIHKPNNILSENGNECQFTTDGPIMLQNLGYSLPNSIDARPATIFTNAISAYPLSCFTYSFSSNICGNTFSWTFGDTVNNTSALANPTHTFSQAGEYTVSVNVNGTIRTLKITVGGTEPVISGSMTACVANAPKTHHSIYAEEGQTIQWSIISGAGSMSMSTQPDVTINWTSLPGTVRVTTTDASGCVNYADQLVTSYCPGDVCASNIVFGLPETATAQTYQVSNSIITENNYRVNSGSDITLIAANFIDIRTDSHIKPGALFFAKIDECVAPRPATKSNEEAQLIAYPNPTDGLLHIQGIKFNEVYLFDVLGKSIFNAVYDSIDNTTIDMGNLTQGVYFIKVVAADGNIETLKIIKE